MPIPTSSLLLVTRRAGVVLLLLLAVGLLAACDRGPSIGDVRKMIAQEQYEAAIEPLRVLLEADPDDPELDGFGAPGSNRVELRGAA